MPSPNGRAAESSETQRYELPESLVETLKRMDAERPLDPGETISAKTLVSATVDVRQRLGPDAVARLPRLDVGMGDEMELRVLGVLGRGGMGQVELAEQRSLSREVAIKSLIPGRVDSQGVGALLHEGVVTGRLEHPNIIPVHMLGLDGGEQPVIVMKRVEGVSWSALIQRDDHPAWEKAKIWSTEPLMRHLEIFLDVCSAIQLAHSRGIVHRDVKPSHVMIGSFGEVYLMDWGVATDAGTPSYEPGTAVAGELPLGTPAYMAPEMLSTHGTIDERTDVYLLGAVLHEVLTKRPPHDGVDLFPVLQSVARSAPHTYDPTVPRELAAVCHRAMSASPAQRFADVEELREALAEYMRHRSSLQLASEAAARLRRLEERIAGLPEDPSDAEFAEVRRLYVETSFGLRQALRQWEGNTRAALDLQRCIEAMIEHELSRGNAEAAYSLLAELPEQNSSIASVVKRARDELLHSRERLKSLEKLEHELDVSVSRRQRLMLFVGASVIGVASASLMGSWGGRPPIVPVTARGGVVLMAIVAVAMAFAVVVWRKWLLRNAANRRIITVMWVCVIGMGISRAYFAYFDGAHPHLVANDLLVCAAATAVGVATIDRRLAVMASLFGAGSLAALLLPKQEVVVFIIFTVAALIAGGLLLTTGVPSKEERRAARKK